MLSFFLPAGFKLLSDRLFGYSGLIREPVQIHIRLYRFHAPQNSQRVPNIAKLLFLIGQIIPFRCLFQLEITIRKRCVGKLQIGVSSLCLDELIRVFAVCYDQDPRPQVLFIENVQSPKRCVLSCRVRVIGQDHVRSKSADQARLILCQRGPKGS